MLVENFPTQVSRYQNVPVYEARPLPGATSSLVELFCAVEVVGGEDGLVAGAAGFSVVAEMFGGGT